MFDVRLVHFVFFSDAHLILLQFMTQAVEFVLFSILSLFVFALLGVYAYQALTKFEKALDRHVLVCSSLICVRLVWAGWACSCCLR